MPKITLPLLAANTRIGDALEQLSDAQPSAAAVFQDDQLRLITRADMVIARFNNLEVVSEVPSTTSPSEDEPIRIWMGKSADLSYSMHLGRHEFTIMAPQNLNKATLEASIASQWLSGRGFGRVKVELAREPADERQSPRLQLDDLAWHRFGHPWANVGVDDAVWRIVSAPPQDFYCTGMPRHDRFTQPVREGIPCPRGHNPPAFIVKGK